MLLTAAMPAPKNTTTSAMSATSVPGCASHHTTAARAAQVTSIHIPAAVTHIRARRSGKLQASVTFA